MTVLKMAALCSLMAVAGVAGCSSNGYNATKNSNQTSDSEYRSSSGSYMANSSIGQIMTTPHGMTVYTFDKDKSSQSNCYDECAKHWPPVTADMYSQKYGQMTLVSRTDGTRQWAHDGNPLYTYAEDAKLGDVKGDNVGTAWHVVR